MGVMRLIMSIRMWRHFKSTTPSTLHRSLRARNSREIVGPFLRNSRAILSILSKVILLNPLTDGNLKTIASNQSNGAYLNKSCIECVHGIRFFFLTLCFFCKAYWWLVFLIWRTNISLTTVAARKNGYLQCIEWNETLFFAPFLNKRNAWCVSVWTSSV